MEFIAPDYSQRNLEDMASEIGLSAKHIPILMMTYQEESVAILEALKAAIEARDYEAIRHNAHSIKGSSGNLKFNELYDMAKAMEFAGRDQDENFDYEAAFSAIEGGLKSISI